MKCRTNKSFGMSSRKLALHPTFELNCDRQIDMHELQLVRRTIGSVSLPRQLADLTVSNRPGTSYQMVIHFAVVNHLYLLFSFVKLVET